MAKPIKINRAIHKSPTLGGIPLSIAFPGAISFFAIALPCRMVLSLNWFHTFLIAGWLTLSWFIASGGDNFKFLSKLSPLIRPRWVRGRLKSTSLLNNATKH